MAIEKRAEDNLLGEKEKIISDSGMQEEKSTSGEYSAKGREKPSSKKRKRKGDIDSPQRKKKFRRRTPPNWEGGSMPAS